MAAATGFPASVPFIIALDYGTPSEEIALVTAVAGLSFTVTRGYDGTSATSHNTGAPVRHTWTAMDGNDSRAHEGSAVGVHGISGLSSVVGTTDVQTLTNKTLTAPAISGGSIAGNVTGNPTFTAGVKAGSTGQFVVDTAGKPSSTNFMPTYVESGISATTSSTSYGNSTVTVSTTLTCPPSGKVFVSGVVSQFINSNNLSLFSGVDATGSVSGSLRAVNDSNSMRWTLFDASDTGVASGTQTYIIVSANPGETITLTWKHRVTGGTAQMDFRNISAFPLVG